MEKSILQGLRNAFEKNNELRGFNVPKSDGTIKVGYADLKPEFFIQCQIAFQIKTDFSDYEIALEVPTELFKNSSVDINERLSLNSFFRKWKIHKNGFLDIGIYDINSKAICPIEIKLINPQKKRILKDLKRLLDFLNNDNSTIDCAYFVYIYKEKIHYSLEQITTDITNANNKIQKLLNAKFENYKNKFIFDSCCESIGSYSNFESSDQMDGYEPLDLGELISENIHYVGVVIKITKR
ncbi:MAG: hypothetical protein GT596_11550 [Bacteroidales bacterium]|nr:hypothetical protein [Bacteroidales bacterium]